jgi:hypothetical protein
VRETLGQRKRNVCVCGRVWGRKECETRGSPHVDIICACTCRKLLSAHDKNVDRVCPSQYGDDDGDMHQVWDTLGRAVCECANVHKEGRRNCSESDECESARAIQRQHLVGVTGCK